MKKYIFMIAIMNIATSNAATCTVSDVSWDYTVLDNNGGTMGSGKEQWKWEAGTKELKPNVSGTGGYIFAGENRGTFVLGGINGVEIDSVVDFMNRTITMTGFRQGSVEGRWGGFNGTSNSWSTGAYFLFKMNGENIINNLDECGGWVDGIMMTTTLTKMYRGTSLSMSYNSTFKFKTAHITEKINIELRPTTIELQCEVGSDCNTSSNIMINNPTSWSGKVFITYPTVEGVNYEYYGNWVEQAVDVHKIEANTSPTFMKSIRLYDKKPGVKIYSIPIQVEIM